MARRGGAIFAAPFTQKIPTTLSFGENTTFVNNVASASLGGAVVASGVERFEAWDSGRYVNNSNPAVLVQKESITSGLLNNW